MIFWHSSRISASRLVVNSCGMTGKAHPDRLALPMKLPAPAPKVNGRLDALMANALFSGLAAGCVVRIVDRTNAGLDPGGNRHGFHHPRCWVRSSAGRRDDFEG